MPVVDQIIQLTSVSAIQNSLDILRQHRPDYTPRTGFVWPITDPSVAEAQNKRESETSVDAEADSAVPQEKRSGMPKKQQNNMLLMHAMNTTAAHSKISFTASFAAQNTDNAGPDTPVTTTIRSSATPAPMSQETGSKVGTPQETARGQTTGTKKKKKRTSQLKCLFNYRDVDQTLGTSLAPPPAPS